MLIWVPSLQQYPRLTRWRGRISPWEMTVDPVFLESPYLPYYGNRHENDVDGPPPTTARRVASDTSRGRGAWLALAPLIVILRRRG